MLNNLRIGIKLVANVFTVLCLCLSLFFPNDATMIATIPLIVISLGSLVEDCFEFRNNKKVRNKLAKFFNGLLTTVSALIGVALITYCLFFSLFFNLNNFEENERVPIAVSYYVDNSSSENTTPADSTSTISQDVNKEELIREKDVFYETYYFAPKDKNISFEIGNLKGLSYNYTIKILIFAFSILCLFDWISTCIVTKTKAKANSLL